MSKSKYHSFLLLYDLNLYLRSSLPLAIRDGMLTWFRPSTRNQPKARPAPWSYLISINTRYHDATRCRSRRYSHRTQWMCHTQGVHLFSCIQDLRSTPRVSVTPFVRYTSHIPQLRASTVAEPLALDIEHSLPPSSPYPPGYRFQLFLQLPTASVALR